MLAELKMPFTGCPPAALRLALDKAKTKKLLKEAGIPTPDFQVLSPANHQGIPPGFSLHRQTDC